MHETGPFSIPAIRDFVPPKLRPWIIIVFVIVFQFSGGLYLAAVSEMVGSTALMQEDIMMAGYASMIGMGLTFAIMFRLKFRFASKTSLMTCSIALIVSNLICMQTHSIPVLVITCFFAGIFRMWATFECNSTIQLWLTPKRDLSVFFCFIYLLVQSCIQLSGLITVYTAFWAKWEYMHWLIIGLLLLVMLATLCLFRSYRSLPKLPLFGIDWLGALMWGLVLLCILFVCVYGEHYDWYQSFQIRAATVIGILILALNLWRASFIRHSFIALKTWTYRAVWFPFILYIVIDILLAPSHLFEHIYMESSKYKTASDIFLPIEVSLYPKGGTSSVIKNPSLQELELKLKDYQTVANSDGLSVGLKFDKDVTMGIVEDVKEVIRTTLSHK